MNKEKSKAPFRVGDFVTTDYDPLTKKKKRQIVKIERAKGFKSKWACVVKPNIPLAFINLDAEEARLDSGWFQKWKKSK